MDIDVGSAVNTPNVHVHFTHCYWVLLGRTDVNLCESARVAVVPDSRSVAVLVADHCSGCSWRSFTPAIPKGRKVKCMKDQEKTSEDLVLQSWPSETTVIHVELSNSWFLLR